MSMVAKKKSGMENRMKLNKQQKKGILMQAVKGMLIAMIFTIAAILIFALIIKEANVADSVINPVNQVIKILGIMLAAFFAVRKCTEHHWLVGAVAGMLYIVLGYLVFSLIEGRFGNLLMLLSDFLMAAVIGMVFAIILKQLLRKKK
jgi:putative membrane protein (TIGR04086 family)